MLGMSNDDDELQAQAWKHYNFCPLFSTTKSVFQCGMINYF